ncbi:MaoC family dehydratase N-terminal domain-containing protein [Rhodoferax ferrireducens]|uniref:MaoC family dehydratase N-terminal domain-containing protein n=1 Tax=Rhodoferax ferrireducens TaxID=192843 RepID=UPI000E0DD09E|nr:MaoC family dehydratase N-terminal domain-containing protein [Rhodoferax ferrireducens]
MIAPHFKGYTTASSKVRVDAWRVKLFCQAIGETNPIHWDETAARAAGYRACPIPPTFLKALESEHCSSAALLQVLMVSMGKVLHAEQSFDYARPVYVGDEVEITRTITDLYDKREGTMSFIVVQTHYRVEGIEVGTSVQTILIRNQEMAAA